MFLVDKYAIYDVNAVNFNKEFYSEEFPKLSESVQNLLIHGYDCSGKKTLVKLLLKSIYGEGVDILKEEEYEIYNYGSNVVKVKLILGHYHIVFTPFGSAIDKYIIQEILSDFCKKDNKHYFKTNVSYKSIIIYKADVLSYPAQHALRNIIEDYTGKVRFFLTTKNVCSICDPVRSRLLEVSLRCPTNEEHKEILESIAKREEITLSDVNDIVATSGGSLTRSLYIMECERLGLKYKCFWKENLNEILDKVCNKPILSLTDMLEIREKLGRLFITNIESEKILQYLSSEVCSKINTLDVLVKIFDVLSTYDTRLKNATRFILHLEALLYNIHNLIHNSK